MVQFKCVPYLRLGIIAVYLCFRHFMCWLSFVVAKAKLMMKREHRSARWPTLPAFKQLCMSMAVSLSGKDGRDRMEDEHIWMSIAQVPKCFTNNNEKLWQLMLKCSSHGFGSAHQSLHQFNQTILQRAIQLPTLMELMQPGLDVAIGSEYEYECEILSEYR